MKRLLSILAAALLLAGCKVAETPAESFAVTKVITTVPTATTAATVTYTEIYHPSGIKSVQLDIPIPESGANVVIKSTADWEETFGVKPPVEGITLMESFGQYVCYRYEYREGNNIVTGIGYVDVLTMINYTVRDIVTRDPSTYKDKMEAMLSSNLPEYIPNTFRFDDGKLYFYVYTSWSGENIAADNGYHGRTIFEYDFLSTWTNFGMYEDDPEKPFSLNPSPPPLPSEVPEIPTEAVISYGQVADTEYIKAANSAQFGYLAYNEDYVFYRGKDGNLYRKTYTETETGLADKGDIFIEIKGNLRNICVSGEYVYYVEGTGETEAAAYKIKIDGGESEKVLDNVGDYFYVYGETLAYTANDGNLYLLTDTEKQIDTHAEAVNFTDNEISYIDGENFKVYDISSGQFKLHLKLPVAGVDNMVRYRDKLVYHYRYGVESRTYTGIGFVDLPTGERRDLTMTWTEYNENALGGKLIPAGMNIFDGILYFHQYDDYRGDGYYERNVMGVFLDADSVFYAGQARSDTPIPENFPYFYGTSHGLYEFNTEYNLSYIDTVPKL
ncbi:MAG: DUF5050 domain-containing protein [Ruminococcus sp.]|jgi:hypothetical protein|nr:DUF5050 domain-containing protein [Ruminococcus sp.]